MCKRHFLITIISIFLLSGCTGSSSYYSDDYDYEVEERESVVTSDNWECTDDCSGHNAGYEWASDKGIDDPDDCGGNSDSFIEGCEAYVNEQQLEEDIYEEYDDSESYYDY